MKKVFKKTLEGKGSVGKPRMRCLDDVVNDLKKTGVGGWRRIGKGRDAWKLDCEGGQGPAWTVERVEREREREGVVTGDSSLL
jgi:hypothetical protein